MLQIGIGVILHKVNTKLRCLKESKAVSLSFSLVHTVSHGLKFNKIHVLHVLLTNLCLMLELGYVKKIVLNSAKIQYFYSILQLTYVDTTLTVFQVSILTKLWGNVQLRLHTRMKVLVRLLDHFGILSVTHANHAQPKLHILMYYLKVVENAIPTKLGMKTREYVSLHKVVGMDIFSIVWAKNVFLKLMTPILYVHRKDLSGMRWHIRATSVAIRNHTTIQ